MSVRWQLTLLAGLAAKMAKKGEKKAGKAKAAAGGSGRRRKRKAAKLRSSPAKGDAGAVGQVTSCRDGAARSALSRSQSSLVCLPRLEL